MAQLEKLFADLRYETAVQRAAFVKWMLGNNNRASPFYYKIYKDGKVPIVRDTPLLILLHLWQILQGIFQSRIILVTLATHYTAIANLSLEHRAVEKPVGALILSIQAVGSIFNSCSMLILSKVKRALLYWKSWTKQVPSGTAGYFSRTNWDDHVERVNGHDVLVKNVTSLINLVLKLHGTQWMKIMDGAMALAKHRKVGGADSDVIVMESSDFEIEDGDEDILNGDDDLM
jgi:hypothetical protein